MPAIAHKGQIIMGGDNGVTTFNGRSGSVLPVAGDYDATQVNYSAQQTVKQKIEQIYADNGVLGAKNLLKYPYVYTTRTVNGMTYTDLGNGAVRATSEGATTGNADFHFAYFNESTLPKGKYYLSDGGASTNSVRIIVNKHNGSTYLSQLVVLDANHHDVEMDVDYDGYTDVRVLIWASTGATANNLVFKPMLRLASDPDDTYQPYTMTNRELTEKAGVWTSPVSCLVDDTSATITNAAIHTTSTINPYIQTASGAVVAYSNLAITEGQAVITFGAALTEAASVKLQILNI